MIIKNEYPKDWARMIRDNAERERIRLMLRATDSEWCDYKAGTCVCS